MWSSQRILIKISGNNGCLAPVLFMYSNHFTIIKKYNFDNKNGIYFFLDLTQFPNFEWWYWIEKHIFLCLSFINIIPMWHPIVDYTSFDNLRSKFFFCSNPTVHLDRCCIFRRSAQNSAVNFSSWIFLRWSYWWCHDEYQAAVRTWTKAAPSVDTWQPSFRENKIQK